MRRSHRCPGAPVQVRVFGHVGGGVLDLDLVAVGVKLVRDDGRETRERPLAEFDVLAKDRDGVVGRDTDERIRGELARACAFGGESLPSQSTRIEAEADQETRAGNRRAFEEATPVGWFFHQRHAQPSMRRAASWIAARMRL